MEDKIKENIKQFLSLHTPPTEPCHIIYLLVSIRKLLEINPLLNNDILKFYCDWCLHTEKSRNIKDIEPIVMGIENSITGGRMFEGGQFSPAGDNAVRFIYKQELNKSMKDLFATCDLPTEIFEEANWLNFLHLLVQVLEEQPMIISGKLIESICFKPVIGKAANLEVKFKAGQTYSFINVF